MSEFKVREVGVEEEKSVQEIEEQLLNEHQEKVSAEQENEAQTESVQENEAQEVEQEVAQTPELSEEDVLSFIKIGTINKLIPLTNCSRLGSPSQNYRKMYQLI